MLELIELPDRWSLSSEDAEITRLCFDWAVTLTIGPMEPQADVRIEGEIELSGVGPVVSKLLPENDPIELAPLLRIVRSKLTTMVIFKDGRLRIDVGEITLQVAPSDEFEAWEIVGLAGRRLVSMPGGGVTVWST